MEKNHQYYMNMALEEARKADGENEVPIGAVIVFEEQVVVAAHNQVVTDKHPLAHAELLALQTFIEDYRAEQRQQSILYVTLEPCPMCLGAILQARIGTLVFGAYNLKWGSCGTVIDISHRYPTILEVVKGICEAECSQLLKAFFKSLRESG